MVLVGILPDLFRQGLSARATFGAISEYLMPVKLTPIHEDIPYGTVNRIDRAKCHKGRKSAVRAIDPVHAEGRIGQDVASILSAVDQLRPRIARVVKTTKAL